MTEDKLTLGLDVDGVLLDYISGIYEYLPSVGITPALEPENVDCFSFKSFLPGRSREEIEQVIADFSVTEGFGRIPTYKGALEAILGIKERFGDDLRIVAITSAGTSEETMRLRKLNLREFPLDELHLLPLGGNKTQLLEGLGSRSVFVDDLHKNIADAEKVGVRGILYRQLYNAMDDHDLTMKSWDEDGLKTVIDALNEKQSILRHELA